MPPEPNADLNATEECANWLKTLAAPEAFPTAALTSCLEHFEILAPELRLVLEKAADGDELSSSESWLVFWGLHLMAAKRDTRVFQPLLRILRQPGDYLDELLGDTITETLPRVAVSLFDGDAASLFDLLADQDVDEFVRWSLFSALAFLTFDGKISGDLTEAFLLRFDTEDLADEEDVSWLGWQEAISLLALRSLAERVERRRYNEVMAACHGDGPEAFYKDLEIAEAAAPNDITRFTKARIGYFEDICGSLDWIQIKSEEDKNSIEDHAGPKLETYINPWRNVGRNDPCPCGSGKKAKKCCLASA